MVWSAKMKDSTFQSHFGYLHTILFMLFKERLSSMLSTESLIKVDEGHNSKI